MTFEVFVTDEAVEELAQLCLGNAHMLPSFRRQVGVLMDNPFTCRVADSNPFEREILVPAGDVGTVALFEIVNEECIVVVAFRKQRDREHLYA